MSDLENQKVRENNPDQAAASQPEVEPSIPELPEDVPQSDEGTSSSPIPSQTEELQNNPQVSPPPDIIAYIRVGGGWEILPYNPTGSELNSNEMVIIDLDDGVYFGTVVEPSCPLLPGAKATELPKVLRRASLADVEKIESTLNSEKQAGVNFKEIVSKSSLEMKLVGVRALLDGSRITFFYTAEDRVDFREVVRDLARIYHTRIEMWQIGVRDEARRLGGIGICGRELCCASFLREFLPVTMKMAKEQGLALAPTKISGCCGRLMCCLAYENDWYNLAKEDFPKVGDQISWSGRTMRVQALHFLTGEVTLSSDEDNVRVRVSLEGLVAPTEPSEEP